MISALMLSSGLATLLAQISLGGGLFEHSVLDPVWPTNPALIQPRRGGFDRKRFWIAAHIAFELSLVIGLVVAWHEPEVWAWLMLAAASHVLMRLWSAVDFIPKALAFERAEPHAIASDAARRWARRSLWRLPLALTTSLATLAAFAASNP
jgi:hypothetical protein